MTKKIAGLGPQKPYWQDYDQEEDEKLAESLIFGWQVVNALGRAKIEFPSPSKSISPQERLAREALARVVMHQFKDDSFLIGYWLCCAIRDDGSSTWRIDFRRTKLGRPTDRVADLQISQHVQGLMKGRRGDVKAAVVDAKKRYDRPSLHRTTVSRALKRAKKRSELMGK
jgi:hypothetical protein